MAKNTSTNLRNLTIYQVYPRAHSKTGDFKGVTKDLDRIKSLGFDYIYLLPIHQIGEKSRKGSLGSPYSIKDYYSINEELGTLEDFKELIEEAHKRGLKVMMDFVFNHTSRDSRLLSEHPDWFYRNQEGNVCNKVGDWWDICDLNFANKGLWTYLIDVMKYWANLKVDSFRCDVAPMLPIEFWLEARKEIAEINPNLLWVAESIHLGFVKYLRDMGYQAMSDSETFEAFDICYDYDAHDDYLKYLTKEAPLQKWVDKLMLQDCIYPSNYVKLRNLENHDQERIAHFLNNDLSRIYNFTAFNYFIKGAAFVYAGQERLDDNRPSLFEQELVNWDKGNIEGFITKLNTLKKKDIFAIGHFNAYVTELEDTVIAKYEAGSRVLIGIFNLNNNTGTINIGKVLENITLNGKHTNLLNDEEVLIEDNLLNVGTMPVIINVTK